MDLWANAKDLGLKGDGITDDTEALKNAVEKYQTIYFPQENTFNRHNYFKRGYFFCWYESGFDKISIKRKCREIYRFWKGKTFHKDINRKEYSLWIRRIHRWSKS